MASSSSKMMDAIIQTCALCLMWAGYGIAVTGLTQWVIDYIKVMGFNLCFALTLGEITTTFQR